MATSETTRPSNTGFRISRTKLQTGNAPQQSLHNLPTSARPAVDARDVVVPDGCTVEPVS